MTQTELAAQIRAASGADFSACYQCTRCSAGCPAQSRMERKPSQMIRLLQYGRLDELLASRGIWACIGCQTCSARCPNAVDVAGILDALRALALAAGAAPGLPEVAQFHRQFLKDIRRRGRIHEPQMVARYQLAIRRPFKDLGLGIRMFLKGKMPLLPHGVKDKRAIKTIFAEAAAAKGASGGKR